MSFFSLSKILWFFVQPSMLIALVLLAGLVFMQLQRRYARTLLWGGFAALFVGGLSPLAHILTIPLENRFERPDLPRISGDIAGLIVLGGAQDTIVTMGRGIAALTDAGERLTEAQALARKLPGKPLVFSGGGNQLVYKTLSEAEGAQRFFISAGLNKERIQLETRSRNTWQNARYTADLLRQQGLHKKRWLLVTSAFHMPRSMGCFRKAGLDVVAWPVDYRTRGWRDVTRLFPRPSQGLRRLDLITKEWLGLLVYRLTGRTTALLPAPS